MSQAQFKNVTVTSKANIYFDGKVISHSIVLENGSKKTLGLIYPGSFLFNTGAPEKMEIISGTCKVRIKGEQAWKEYSAHSYFDVPANSAFEISVDTGITEYICSFE